MIYPIHSSSKSLPCLNGILDCSARAPYTRSHLTLPVGVLGLQTPGVRLIIGGLVLAQ